MPDSAVTPEQLASALAARLIHDFIGPASGIVSAFDLISDPAAAAMREEALALAEDSARRLVELLALSRMIYGGGGALSAADIEGAGKTLFAQSRASLDLFVDPTFVPGRLGGRVAVGCLQTLAGAAAAGGAVSLSLRGRPDGGARIAGQAIGPRVRLPPEVIDGLAGRSAAAGLPQRWSPAYLLGALARSAGGEAAVSEVDGGVAIRVDIARETA